MKMFGVLAASVALAGLAVASSASAALVNYALTTDGASFVSGSSIIAQGTFGLTMNYPVMESNLLTDTPSPSINNGDTRYLFADGDPNGTIEIDLGQIRQINQIGALVDLPGVDRPIFGPFAVQVSTDNVVFTNWGAPQAVASNSPNPMFIGGPTAGVRYVRYSFGPTGFPYGPGNGGAGVQQLFAESSAAPEPAAWALMIAGFGLAGASLRRRNAATA